MMASKEASIPYAFLREDTAFKTNAGILQLPAAFVLGFVCVYLKTLVSMTPLLSLPDVLDKGLLFVGAAFLSLQIVSEAERYVTRLVPFLLFLLSTVYTYLASGETAPLAVSLIIIAAATVENPRLLVRLWLCITAFFSLFLIAVYALTAFLAPENFTYVLRFEGGVVSAVRLTFFFSHPNMVAAVVMMMCGAYMYLNYERLGFGSYAVVLAIALLVLFLTDSKTSTALIVLLVVCFAGQKRWGIFARRGMKGFIALLPLLLFGSVFLVAGPFYNDSLGNLLTGRVSLWHYCLLNQGVTLLGQQFMATQSIGFNGWVYYYTTLDCAYASGLFVLGLCFSTFFCWCIVALIKRDGPDLPVKLPLVLVMLVFGVTEVHIFSPVICAPLLLLGGGLLPVQRAKSASLNKAR